MRYWKHQLAIAIWATATAQAATDFYAHLNTAETNVFLGQVFNVDVVVKASAMPDTPDLSNLADFNATVLEEGKPTSETNTWLYRYAFRAKREGNLTIPSVRFGNVSTKPAIITANKPELTDRMELRLGLSRHRVYLGEPVLLTSEWRSTYPFGTIKSVDFHFPVLSDPRFQVLDLHEPEKESQSKTTGLPVHGTRILATRSDYAYQNKQYQMLSFGKILIPKRTGILSIAPASLLCASEKEMYTKNQQSSRSAFQYPAYFDNTFFDQNTTGGNWDRIYTESSPLELEVRPLPIEDRPELFNGMVGDYDIQVSAEPTEVHVGDPITLTITVTTKGYMESIFFQPLRYQPLLINRFEISADRALPLREGKSKIYTQTIRPLSTGDTVIPPIQLAFFSPTSNAYITVQSDPIPIQVSPAEEIAVFGAGLQQNQLRAVEKGIRHNYESPDMLKSRPLPLLGSASPFSVLGILLLPPIIVGVFSLVSLFGKKRHHIHRTAKAARAYKVFRKNAAHIIRNHSMKSEIYNDLDQVLRAYLGDRLHLNPGALSFHDAEARLVDAGADESTIAKLRELFMICEAYRFTHGFDEQANAKQIIHAAVRIIRNVETSLK